VSGTVALAIPGQANQAVWRDFTRDCRARGLRDTTLAAYADAVTSLARWAGGREVAALAKPDIQDWLIWLAGRGLSQSTASAYYRGCHRFFVWAAAEQIIAASPMHAMSPPRIDEIPVPLPAAGAVPAVIAACERDKSARGLRDTAIVRIWASPGSPRASEMAGLAIADADMTADRLTIAGKGGKTRLVPMDPATARAVARWLRARPAHPYRILPPLFLGTRGPMTRSGMFQLLEARCAAAGVARIHPHQFRHYTTHDWLARGGREGDIAYLNGWSKKTAAAMLARYGAALEAERAIAAARTLPPAR